ncbi:MAG: OsmC family protein [Candidatus Bathyarchaeia archaeon]
MPTQSDLAENVRKENSERRGLMQPKIATHRIDVKLVERLHFEASFGSFSFAIDEPSERGGTDKGLPPLAYFLAGAASCLMTQYMKLADEKKIQIDSMETIARGHFDRRIGGAFTDIEYDINMQSSCNADQMKSLMGEAEGMCYAHNTLKKAVLMKTSVTLNGTRIT